MHKKSIISSSSLSAVELKNLISGEVSCILCKRFSSRHKLQADLNEVMLDSHTVKVLSTTGKIVLYNRGDSVFEALKNKESLHQYLTRINSNKTTKPLIAEARLRDMFQCLVNAWTPGIKPLFIENIKCNFGVWRIFVDSAEAIPHIDSLQLPEYKWVNIKHFKQYLSVVLYLSTPLEGGWLELWFDDISLGEYTILRTGNNFGIKRNTVSKCHLTVKPEVGDLIIFKASKLHAVSRWECGFRGTLSFFIGYSGNDKPLILFS